MQAKNIVYEMKNSLKDSNNRLDTAETKKGELITGQ